MINPDTAWYPSPMDCNGTFSEEEQTSLELFRQRLLRCRKVEEALDVVWSSTEGIIPRDRIGLSFLSPDGETLTAAYYITDYQPVLLTHNYSAGISSSTLSLLIEERSIRIINNLETYLKFHPRSSSTRLLVEEGVRSNLSLPLQVDNRNVGFLFFSSRQKESFTTHHACLLRALLDEMSALIEKAWMIDQLSKARKDYLTMLGFVAHELKAPLATMTTMGHMYLDGYFGPQDKAGIDTISKMLKISGYMINMIQNYLGLSQLETGEMRFKPQEGVKFREDVLDFVINTLDARIRERNAQIKIEGSDEITLEADPDLLRIVFTNLVDNAVKYGEENGEINIHYQTDNQKLTFKIRNTGVGFTPEQASQLFKRFSRLHQKGLEDRKGTGLGLYLTWWIIQKHRGHISASSRPGKWAEFYVELPLTQTQSIN